MCSGEPDRPGHGAGDVALLNAALESMPYGFSVWDEQHRLLLWNRNYLDIYRMPAERIRKGMPLEELCAVTVEAGNHPGKTTAEVYATYKGWLDELTAPYAHSAHEKTIAGRVIRSSYLRSPSVGWVVTHADITDQKRQVEALREREVELQYQNMRFAAAVDNMSHGLCMFNADRRLIICNKQYATLYGLPVGLMTPGTSLKEILDYRMAHGLHPVEGKEAYLRRRFELAAAGVEEIDTVELKDGRIISIHHQPMPDGGWVSTHQDVTEQRRNEERIRHLARHDALTDLPNRMLFRESMEAAEGRIRRGEAIAVLCIDLDYFKSVNDTLGHSIGDAVLKEVAVRLKNCCRGADIVARLGGDEFAVLIGPLRKASVAARLCDRIVKSIAEPFEIGDHRILIGASIGIAVSPDDGLDATTLMSNADLALYRAKSEGRSTFHFFEQGMDAALQERRAIEVGLRHAVANGDLRLVFQPFLSLADNRVSGLEALLRWYHPDRGMIAPEAFVPVAEESGLIVPIGEWVLREACAAAAAWPEHIHVAVNLSPVQFRNRNLVQHVKEALAAARLAAERLELEVTETLLVGESQGILKTLHELREIGVKISMDDFGTGYSSLSYLRKFPFDKIKIDRTFVHELANAGDGIAIVKAVIGLGRSLGISTSAEGVETEAQLELVRAQGCSEVQGFFFSPPLPASAVGRLFAGPRPLAARPRDAATAS
jgi:diguanylate cyclase (GGDEF)-like protein